MCTVAARESSGRAQLQRWERCHSPHRRGRGDKGESNMRRACLLRADVSSELKTEKEGTTRYSQSATAAKGRHGKHARTSEENRATERVQLSSNRSASSVCVLCPDLGDEPLLGIFLGDFLFVSNPGSATFACGDTLTSAAQHNVEIHTVDSDLRIVLQTQIDVLLHSRGTETKVDRNTRSGTNTGRQKSSTLPEQRQ